MTTTRSRSMTITVDGEDVRILIDGAGVISYSALPIGKIVEKGEGWAPASLSGVTGRTFDLQREAIAAVATRFHRQAVHTARANQTTET